MTAIEILTAIGGTKSLATLDGFARTVWQRWGANEVTDEQAQSLAEAIEARKREVRGIDTVTQRAPHVAALAKAQGRLSHFPAKRKQQCSPDRRASIERRRTLAASGPMPPRLASQFTTGELARPAAGRRRGTGQAALHAHPWRARGPRGRRGHDRPQRHPRGRRPRLSDHRGAAPRQAAQPLQCRADRLARMACLDRARPEKFERRPRKRQRFRFPEGRVQKNGVHG